MTENKKQETGDEFRKRYVIDPESGCWTWNQNKDKWGYGRIKRDGKTSQAHRISYEMHVGAIPADLFVLHECDNPACVNPGHLFLGTHQENMDDCRLKGRRPHGEKHPAAKISDSDVISIRLDARSQRTIALSYGLSQRHVGRIKRGEGRASVSFPSILQSAEDSRKAEKGAGQ